MDWKRSTECLLACALFGFLLAGCQDAPPTGTTEGTTASASKGKGPPGGGGPPDQAAPEARINHLIADLFPQPEKSQAHQLFADTKSALSQGDTGAARESALDLLALALELLENDELQDPPGPETAEEALAELVDTLLAFVGLDAAGAGDVLAGDTDGVVAVASPDEDNTIVTEDEFAGTVIEEEDLDQEILVVIERVLQAEQDGLPQGDCLPTGEDQADGCYRFDKSPDDPFQDEVVVGVCPEDGIRNGTDPNSDQFQLGKFDPDFPGDGVVALPSEPAPFLDCTGFTVASAQGSGLWPLIEGGWDATGKRVLSWLAPEPLWAVDAGLGGSAINWSRIGWFRPLAVQLTAGDGQTDFAGFPVDQDPTVAVIGHTPIGGSGPLPGVDVAFSVTGGGGSVSSTTVTTDGVGQAAVGWRLGSAGTNTIQAVVPGDTGTFTATADPIPLPIQTECQAGGGGDRVFNQLTTDPDGRAFYIPRYPSTDLSQVTLWFRADVAGDYDIKLIVRQGSFGGTVLDSMTVPVVSLGTSNFTQVDFAVSTSGITAGSAVTFEPLVTGGPAEEVFFEVPDTDPDPQFTFDGNSSCPIIETEDAADPFDDRRQGVRALIEN